MVSDYINIATMRDNDEGKERGRSRRGQPETLVEYVALQHETTKTSELVQAQIKK
jgi:hypothetical protein